MNTAQRALNAATTAMLYVAVALLVVSVAGVVAGKWRFSPVLSGSMRPAVPEGAIALAVAKPISDVAVGDVLIYHAPTDDSRLIMHRVIEVENSESGQLIVRTKGDNNNTADRWAAELQGDTAWEVRGHVPYVGHAVVATRSQHARTAMTAVGALLILGYGLRHIWGDDTEGGDEHAAREQALPTP